MSEELHPSTIPAPPASPLTAEALAEVVLDKFDAIGKRLDAIYGLYRILADNFAAANELKRQTVAQLEDFDLRVRHLERALQNGAGHPAQ